MNRVRLGRHIEISRARGGIPSIIAPNVAEAARALGYVHALDRGGQIELKRLLAQGRASELLLPDPEVVQFDLLVRRMGIHRFPERDVDGLVGETRAIVKAYVEGINSCLEARRRPLLLRLLNHRPEPWTLADVVLIHRLLSFAGLLNLQLGLQRGLIELVCRGVPADRLKELFGPGVEGMDLDLIRSVSLMSPAPEAEVAVALARTSPIAASNAWAISPSRTATRAAIIANDAHTDVSRLPPLWYEVEINTPFLSLAGATAPGLPGVILGRNQDLGWAVTYSYGDTIDFFVEECRDGKRRVGDGWEPFEERVEELHIKGGELLRFAVFTSQHGTLEGNPYTPGRYLSLSWVGQPGRFHSSLEALCRLNRATTVEEAREVVGGFAFPPLSWIFADRHGNTGRQLAGAYPRRRPDLTGLYPVAGWDRANDWQGLVDADELPGDANPERGYVVAANQAQSAASGRTLVNAPMAGYRYDRIWEKLSVGRDWSVADVQRLQYDLVSLQARRLLPLFLKHTEPGDARSELERWHLNFAIDSRGAGLYATLYRSAVLTVLGDAEVGRETIERLLDYTPFTLGMSERFDAILLNPSSAWYEGRDYESVIAQAVREGLERPREAWGARRELSLENRLVGRRRPVLYWYGRSHIDLPGHHSTIHQAWRLGDPRRGAFVGPSFRFVSDMSSDEVWTNIPGGPSENPLSRLYTADLVRWRFGDYKRLRVKRRR